MKKEDTRTYRTTYSVPVYTTHSSSSAVRMQMSINAWCRNEMKNMPTATKPGLKIHKLLVDTENNPSWLFGYRLLVKSSHVYMTTQPSTIVVQHPATAWYLLFIDNPVNILNYTAAAAAARIKIFEDTYLVQNPIQSERVINPGPINPSFLSTPETTLHDFVVIARAWHTPTALDQRFSTSS